MITYECYKERLTRLRDETIQRQLVERMTLEQKITQWWAGLSDAERGEGYTMDFFVEMLKDTPPRIGAVLFSIGWVRKRSWKVGAPHRRMWVADKESAAK